MTAGRNRPHDGRCGQTAKMPSFILPLILGAFTISLYFSSTNPLPTFDFTSQSQTIMTQASNLEGWHARAMAHPYPDPHSFVPQRENLKLALLRNSPVEHEGFSLAIFAQDDSGYVVVDAVGRVLDLPSSSSDINGLLALGFQTLDLPIASKWRNMWMIKRRTTSQPIDRFFYVSDAEKRETSVAGYSRTETELAWPVAGYHHLPDVLQELFALVLEAREGYRPDRNGGNADLEVISKVQAVLGDL